MRQLIHKLRKQPEEVRTHILHALTIIAGVLLFSIWAYSIGSGLGNPQTQAKAKSDLQPFSALKANLIGGYNDITK